MTKNPRIQDSRFTILSSTSPQSSTVLSTFRLDYNVALHPLYRGSIMTLSTSSLLRLRRLLKMADGNSDRYSKLIELRFYTSGLHHSTVHLMPDDGICATLQGYLHHGEALDSDVSMHMSGMPILGRVYRTSPAYTCNFVCLQAVGEINTEKIENSLYIHAYIYT